MIFLLCTASVSSDGKAHCAKNWNAESVLATAKVKVWRCSWMIFFVHAESGSAYMMARKDEISDVHFDKGFSAMAGGTQCLSGDRYVSRAHRPGGDVLVTRTSSLISYSEQNSERSVWRNNSIYASSVRMSPSEKKKKTPASLTPQTHGYCWTTIDTINSCRF
jgi:hypothetical protein